MLLMTNTTQDARTEEEAHSLTLEFKLGKQIHHLTSTPQVGETAVVLLRTDGKGDQVYSTVSQNRSMLTTVMKNLSGVAAKQIQCGRFHAVQDLKVNGLVSLVIAMGEGGEQYFVHYFGVNPYHDILVGNNGDVEVIAMTEPNVTVTKTIEPVPLHQVILDGDFLHPVAK